MFQEAFLQYFMRRHKKIASNYLLAAEKGDSDGFHDLRVEIKQVRALFNMVSYLDPEFKKKRRFRNFKKLFKAAGIVRDVHVQQEILKYVEKGLSKEYRQYARYLREKEIVSLKEFWNFSRKFKIDALEKEADAVQLAINGMSDVDGESKARERFNTLMNQLTAKRESRKFDEEGLHKIRILSKETRYTLEIVQECFPASGIKSDINNALRGLHQTLGRWHDIDVGINFLAQFKALQNSQFNESSLHDELVQILKKEKTLQIENFHKRWKDFLALFTHSSNP